MHISASGCQSPFTMGLKMSGVDRGVVIMPGDQQRSGLHPSEGAAWLEAREESTVDKMYDGQ